MDAEAKQALGEADPEQVHRGLQPIVALGPLALTLALVFWFWGQWHVVLGLVGIGVGLTLFLLLFIERLATRFGRSTAESVRVLVNAVGLSVGGVLTHWSPLVWVFVPYSMLWFYGMDRWARPRMALFLVGVNAVALSTGAPAELALACDVFSVSAYLVSQKRASLLREVLGRMLRQREELEKAHQELQQMHQRALERERLSSLGMLAAGVTHEINNPMSFVTSNINSMLRDLRDEQNLSELLREYRDDVLPATLDGIKRVNAIVADLRRFARGDPEAHTSYDLDAEVETALRIAHGQLGHVRVEKALGGAGRLVGRPRQIVQVLVNLLVNAGQATASGGLVSVTTRRDSESVLVEVRDSGTGMSEETKRHLFEPFFTTKPAGEGTGLGLSVVHGIMKSHGGRIEVESAPGQGTCFRLWLPLVPPLLEYEPSTDGGMRRRPG
ncbi:sensor histidine kinase [Vitiosangium sp. GDMCC 1.1324]|uniref:sensor histidine kinase n=1 Tax=Vitiosangium sp. (strain GDMCC 1.1324) TaxID=2138576 RepID=UPI000D375AE4|nr:ATP-binding protein [Vitiosangium sp. GDMCC 1.1324]PTL81288.1 histidine kinase [Vitiosangium sp. GDMCC 1.1324]